MLLLSQEGWRKFSEEDLGIVSVIGGFDGVYHFHEKVTVLLALLHV
jgi:hypothetical protein